MARLERYNPRAFAVVRRGVLHPGHAQPPRIKNTRQIEVEMPKLKSKSSAKKRFSFTGTGKIKMKPSGMRHGMSKRPQSMKRKARHLGLLSDPDAKIIGPMLPYGRR